MSITQKQIDEIRALHPRAVFADIKGHPEIELIVRPPTDGEWSIVKKQAADKTVDSNVTLTRSCLIHPDPDSDEYKQLVADYPTLPDHIAKTAAKLGGSDFEITTRKL